METNETKTDFYEVIVNENVEKIESEITINKNKKIVLSNKVEKPELNVELKSYIGRASKNQFCYFIYVTNATNRELKNIDIQTDEFIDEMKYISGNKFDLETEDCNSIGKFENNRYQLKIDSLPSGETKIYEFKVKVGDFKYGINEYELKMSVSAKGEDTRTYLSNENIRTAYPEYVTVTQKLDKDAEKVNIGQEVKYTLSIKNESKIKTNVNIKDNFSEYLENVRAKYNYYDFTVDKDVGIDTIYDIEQEANAKYDIISQEVDLSGRDKKNLLDYTVIIPAGKTLEIEVIGVAAEVFEETEVTNYCTVSGTYIKAQDSQISKFIILPDKYNEPGAEEDDFEDEDFFDSDESKENDGNGDNTEKDNENNDKGKEDSRTDTKENEGKYQEKFGSISGYIWLDQNGDGKKQKDEKTIKGIKVKLYNMDTNLIAKDKDGNKLINYSDNNGKYYFYNIEKGRYIVLFEYDTDEYQISKYHAEGVLEEENSDVIEKEVTIDGNVQKVGITDILEINNNNYENIDMGLIKYKNFDLSLKKYINKVVVTTNSKSKEYKYNNSELAKIEIARKQINNSSVEIEYKIVVTNEGEVDAYASEIVDYIPDGLELNKSCNDWIERENKEAINTTLSGVAIKPGESKEITITCNKVLSDETTGTFINAAEIGKSKNLYNLTDMDSKEKNKNINEDDYSEATLIISINTGIIKNTIIVISIAIGTILIFILFKSKKTKVFIVFIIVLIGVNLVGNVYALNIKLDAGSNPHTFSGDDSNKYICCDPGHPQCSKAAHYYELCNPTPEDIDIDESFVGTKYEYKQENGEYVGTIINMSIEKINEGKTKNGNKEYNFTTTYPIDDFDVNVSYIQDGKRKNGKANNLRLDNNKKGGSFNVSVPANANKIKVEVEAIINDAVKRIDVYGVTKVYKCTSIEDATHGSSCATNTVQRMRRTVPEDRPEFENKIITKSLSTDIEKGDIRIIKVDKDTMAKLKNNVQFRVYYIENNVKYDVQDKNGTIKKETPKVLQIGESGSYDIKNLQLGRKYYFEETKAHDESYELLKSNVEISVKNSNISNKTAEKRATYYIFSRKKVKDAMLNRFGKNGKLNSYEDKKNYVALIYHYIVNSLDNINLDVLTNKIGDTPTDAQIKKLVYCIFDDYVTEERAEKILWESNDEKKTVEYSGKKYTQLDFYAKKITFNKYLGDSNLLKGYESSKVYSYLRKQTPNVIKNKKITGSLIITKYDIDTGIAIPHTKFNIKNNYSDIRAYNKDHITNGSGRIKLKNIPVGEYTITEIETSNSYNLNLQPDEEKKKVTEVEADKVTKVDVSNRQYGNLIITKKDADTSKTLKDVGFKIYTKDGNKKNYIKSYTCGSPSKLEFGNAHVFKTNADGQIVLENIPINKRYYIKECSLSEDMKDYYELDETEYNVKLVTNIDGNGQIVNTYKNIKNKQKYVDLSGYVWDDGVSGKSSVRDNVYKSNDKLVGKDDVTVKLKYNDGTQDIVVATTKTTSDGNYKFKAKDYKIEIAKLANYYIEFEYNGLKYQSVLTDANKQAMGNGSKATEKVNDRSNLNANFSTIIGAKEENGSPNTTIGYNQSRNTKLIYKTEANHSSSLVKNTSYSVDSLKNNISPNTHAAISADTKTAGYRISWRAGLKEIENINLGLYQREMPDLALIQDIDNAKLELTGQNNTMYEYTYQYAKRFQYLNKKIEEEEKKAEQAGNKGTYTYFPIGVSFGNKYAQESNSNLYTRTMYTPDVSYHENKENEKKYKVYITYKIAIRNESTNIYTKANEIINYYDKRYTIDSIKDENNNNISYSDDKTYNNEYKIVKIAANQKVNPFKMKYITIRYKLDDGTIDKLLNGDITLKESVSEITSYSSFSDVNFRVPYGGIDTDSAPDNMKLGNKTTYEDDTDASPAFKINRENRIIRGTVWEDNAIYDLLKKNERKGDGLYNTTNENVIKDVQVELLTQNSDKTFKVADLYQYSDQKKKVEVNEAVTKTNEKGYYEFQGVIPGQYYIKYTYGNDSVICDTKGNTVNKIRDNGGVQKYKSTIYRHGDKSQISNYWYRKETSKLNSQRYSDAKDVRGIYKDGTEINNLVEKRTSSETIKYKTEIDGDGITASKTSNSNRSATYETTLDEIGAETSKFEITLDYYDEENLSNYGSGDNEFKYVFDNMDFGIIRRPKQDIVVTKEISHVEIITADGRSIVSGDPRKGEITHLQMLPDGNIKIEIDSEMIQGAILKIQYEIKVDNRKINGKSTGCEIDYNDMDYYIYGIIPKNNANLKIARVSSIYDYLSDLLDFDEKNETNKSYGWNRIEIKDQKQNGLLSNDAFEKAKKYRQVLQTDYFTDQPPGTERIAKLEVSKVLSNNEEDFYFRNDVEVNTLNGRKPDTSVPGNYVPGENNHEPDDNNKTLTITGPTGEKRNYQMYVIIGISSFIILGLGTFIINKKCLRKDHK